MQAARGNDGMSSAHRQIAGRRIRVRKAVMRRRGLQLLGALAALLLAVSLTMPIPDLGGMSVAVAAIQRAKSFVELMHQRSPGHRLVGHLVKIKHKKFAAHERALPKIRKSLPHMAALPPFSPALPAALVDLVAAPMPMQMASLQGFPVGAFEAAPGGTPGFFLPPGGGFVLPPTQIPTQTPTPPPPTVVPPQAAVPEPGTWVMILLGFAMIGWTLRRSPHREQTAA